MTVKQLIARLRKMPQNLQVGIQAHDSSDHEVYAWPTSVSLLDKADTPLPDWVATNKWEKERYDVLPDEIVILGC